MSDLFYTISWKKSLAERSVRFTLIAGFVLLGCTLCVLPTFFDIIEKRHGIVLNDILLKWMPAINLSIVIFIILWCNALWLLVRCFKTPYLLVLFAWSFLFLTLSRMITISLVPLDAPINLILLKDPLSNQFYHGTFITKDLFYSGHTSTMVLMFLCMNKRWEKIIALCSTFLIGIMVLIQHVHYTIDVVVAPFGAYMVYVLARKVVDKAFSSHKP